MNRSMMRVRLTSESLQIPYTLDPVPSDVFGQTCTLQLRFPASQKEMDAAFSMDFTGVYNGERTEVPTPLMLRFVEASPVKI
jgi:hypothetical protein